MARLILGSRGSALALAQAGLVRSALFAAHPYLEVELRIITTSGDRRQELKAGEGSPAGLKGLFTNEIQEALLDGSIHAAIHSLKDLPGITPPALHVAAVLPRADTADLLITQSKSTLADLPPGAKIGTGSIRRSRQLNWLRPGLDIVDLRGNVPTRLEKLRALDAIVLARAGIERLGYSITGGLLQCDAGTFHVAPLDILPAIGQGAIGIESRRDDDPTNGFLSAIDHIPTHRCIATERELLRLLDGDCRLPVAALATLNPSGAIQARALLFRDSPTPILAEFTGPAPTPVAQSLFHQLSRKA